MSDANKPCMLPGGPADVAAAINDHMAEATSDPNWSGYPRHDIDDVTQ